MSSAEKSLLLVSYDIIDDKRRNTVAKRLQDFGQRVQYSVFECFLNQMEYQKMKERITKAIDPEKDNIRIYKLCQGCSKRIESIGIGRGWQQGDEDKVIIL